MSFTSDIEIAQRCEKRKITEIAKLAGIKERYLDTLGAIERDLREGKTEPRFAYQRMSGAIRGFVYEATGVKVQKYTLYEIKQLRMHRLTQLIEEYYVPEFAEWSQQDALASLHRTDISKSSGRFATSMMCC